MVSYDPNTTYIVYTSDLGKKIEDYGGNKYTLDRDFPNYTYSNSSVNLSPIFGYSSANASVSAMTNVVLGTNCYYYLPDYAFLNCLHLTSVVIPTSVTTIGMGAFSNCPNLNSLIIPDSVVSIGNNAFYGNLKLTTITMGKGVSYIGDYAFTYLGGYTTTPTPKTPTLHWGNNHYVAKYFYSNFNTFVNYDPPYPPTTTTLGATCTLSSSGVDPQTGMVVTASSSASATASGGKLKDALKALLEDVTQNSLLKDAIEFASRHKNTTYTLSVKLDK